MTQTATTERREEIFPPLHPLSPALEVLHLCFRVGHGPPCLWISPPHPGFRLYVGVAHSFVLTFIRVLLGCSGRASSTSCLHAFHSSVFSQALPQCTIVICSYSRYHISTLTWIDDVILAAAVHRLPASISVSSQTSGRCAPCRSCSEHNSRTARRGVRRGRIIYSSSSMM